MLRFSDLSIGTRLAITAPVGVLPMAGNSALVEKSAASAKTLERQSVAMNEKVALVATALSEDQDRKGF